MYKMITVGFLIVFKTIVVGLMNVKAILTFQMRCLHSSHLLQLLLKVIDFFLEGGLSEVLIRSRCNAFSKMVVCTIGGRSTCEGT